MAKWTEDELTILKNNYTKCGASIPELLINHTAQSIWCKAWKIGLKKLWIDFEGNKFDTLTEMCEYHHTTVHSFICKRNRGYSLEKCLEPIIRHKYRDADIIKAAESVGLTYSGFRKRMAKMTLEEAVDMGTTSEIFAEMGKRKAAEQIIDRVGEKYEFKDGSWCEIIENCTYKNSGVTVRFDDGTIRKNVDYSILRAGYCPGGRERKKSKSLGQTLLMKNGLKATIVKYVSSRKILVEFEDGETVFAQIYNFKQGVVGHPFLKTGRGRGTYQGFITKYLGPDSEGRVWYETEKDGVKDIMTPQQMLKTFSEPQPD